MGILLLLKSFAAVSTHAGFFDLAGYADAIASRARITAARTQVPPGVAVALDAASAITVVALVADADATVAEVVLTRRAEIEVTPAAGVPALGASLTFPILQRDIRAGGVVRAAHALDEQE